MSETTATIIVAVIAALGSVVTALTGWMARKGANYVDKKTRVLDAASEIERKEAIKNRIVDTVTLVARATRRGRQTLPTSPLEEPTRPPPARRS